VSCEINEDRRTKLSQLRELCYLIAHKAVSLKKLIMKIIHIALGKANPKRMNGVNKVVHQLASTQTALGYEVTVWGIANDLKHTYPTRNFVTHLFQQHRNKMLCPLLKKAINQLSEDHIIHIHGAFILEFFQIARLLKSRGIEYLFTPHGSFAEAAMEKNKWVKKVYFHLLEKQLIKNAKTIQLLGVNELSHLKNMMTLANDQLIPNGIDLANLPKDLPTRKNKQLVFGFCGRLATYHKGLDLLLKGFQQFLANGGKATLELIGDGKDRPALEELVLKLGIQDAVVFHGALFGLKKFQTINQFDVFLHTSRMEGFPLAVLEAAALSIPCITSEATNINAYIQKYAAGIALSNNTPLAIAKAMSLVADFHQQDTLFIRGENAQKMVAASFDWKNIAQELVRAYAA